MDYLLRVPVQGMAHYPRFIMQLPVKHPTERARPASYCTN
jgi:hypothetical protein